MKNKTVPEIRYKNIEDEWKLIKLSDLMNFSNGINAPKESYGRGRKMISVMDILSEEIIEYKKIRNSVEVKESIESKNKVENGDLIFVRSSEVRNEVGWAKAYLQEQYALHSGFTIRGKKQNEYDAKFIESSLNFRNRYQIESKAGGSTRYNVGQEILKNIEIYIPSLKEQLLISTLIQNIENKINLHQQELKALKQTKQGFLQKMFPREGQSLPEIRFKEFLSPWKEYRLSELSKVTTGKAFKSTDFKINGDYLVITNKNIQDEENEIISKGDRINISDEVILNKYLLSGKNILVTMDGVNIGKTGRYSNNMAVLAQRVGRINSEQFEFIYQITKSPKFISTMNQISVGNAIKHISLQQIADYTFMAPTEVAERLKIGEFFKDIDELILLTDKKIKGLQSTKKGFLQKMFV